jgi:hypothetical protein
VADLKPYVAMLKDAKARIEKGIREGQSAEDLTLANVLAGSVRWGGPGKFITTDKFIDTLYADLTGKKADGFVRHN